MKRARVSTVVAIGKDTRVIGNGNELIWRIPEDLKRFKEITFGHPVIMGRLTFESILSILGKPLPGRTNIVITRDTSWSHPDVIVAHSVEDALEKAFALDSEEVFIGGGAQIYEQALPYIDRLYLTLIEDTKDGDSFFPPYEHLFTKILSEEKHEWNGITYRWINCEREALPASTEDPS